MVNKNIKGGGGGEGVLFPIYIPARGSNPIRGAMGKKSYVWSISKMKDTAIYIHI